MVWLCILCFICTVGDVFVMGDGYSLNECLGV